MKEFSLLMSLYEKENPEWLRLCLDSILASTILPSQIVLVKDGCLTTELEGVVGEYQEQFSNEFTIVQLPVNVGLGAALREGIKHCQHELIARMDSDDLVDARRFELQLKEFESHADVDILGTGAQLIDEFGVPGNLKSVPVEHEHIIDMLWCCPIIHPSVMFKKTVILEAGSYSNSLKRRQDFDLWVNCAIAGARFRNLAQPLIEYRMTSDTFKRNSVSVSWTQAKIGIKCARHFNSGPFAYLGSFYPLVKSLLPVSLAMVLMKLLRNVDPRNRV